MSSNRPRTVPSPPGAEKLTSSPPRSGQRTGRRTIRARHNPPIRRCDRCSQGRHRGDYPLLPQNEASAGPAPHAARKNARYPREPSSASAISSTNNVTACSRAGATRRGARSRPAAIAVCRAAQASARAGAIRGSIAPALIRRSAPPRRAAPGASDARSRAGRRARRRPRSPPPRRRSRHGEAQRTRPPS